MPDLLAIHEDTQWSTEFSVLIYIQCATNISQRQTFILNAGHPVQISINSFSSVWRLKALVEPHAFHLYAQVKRSNLILASMELPAMQRPQSPGVTSPSSAGSDYFSEVQDNTTPQILLNHIRLAAMDRSGSLRELNDCTRQLHEFHLPDKCDLECIIEI